MVCERESVWRQGGNRETKIDVAVFEKIIDINNDRGGCGEKHFNSGYF